MYSAKGARLNACLAPRPQSRLVYTHNGQMGDVSRVQFVATWMAVFMKEKDDPDCTSKLCDQARSALKATPDSDDNQFACLKFYFLDGYCTMQLSSEGE